MMRRGALVVGVHFSGRPQTNDASERLVLELGARSALTGGLGAHLRRALRRPAAGDLAARARPTCACCCTDGSCSSSPSDRAHRAGQGARHRGVARPGRDADAREHRRGRRGRPRCRFCGRSSAATSSRSSPRRAASAPTSSRRRPTPTAARSSCRERPRRTRASRSSSAAWDALPHERMVADALASLTWTDFAGAAYRPPKAWPTPMAMTCRDRSTARGRAAVTRLRILALEPYYGGSHRAVLDGLVARIDAEWTRAHASRRASGSGGCAGPRSRWPPSRTRSPRRPASATGAADRAVRPRLRVDVPEPRGVPRHGRRRRSRRYPRSSTSTRTSSSTRTATPPSGTSSSRSPTSRRALSAECCVFNTRVEPRRVRRRDTRVPAGVPRPPPRRASPSASRAKSRVLAPPFDPAPFDAHPVDARRRCRDRLAAPLGARQEPRGVLLGGLASCRGGARLRGRGRGTGVPRRPERHPRRRADASAAGSSTCGEPRDARGVCARCWRARTWPSRPRSTSSSGSRWSRRPTRAASRSCPIGWRTRRSIRSASATATWTSSPRGCASAYCIAPASDAGTALAEKFTFERAGPASTSARSRMWPRRGAASVDCDAGPSV